MAGDDTYKASLEEAKPKRDRSKKPEDVTADVMATVEPAPLEVQVNEAAAAEVAEQDAIPAADEPANEPEAPASEIKLTRLGHYSYQQSCQAAIIVRVRPDGLVNLVVWDGSGDQQKHGRVPVRPVTEITATFHLSRECPWGR